MKTAGHPQSKEADTAENSRQQDWKQRVGSFHQVQQLQKRRGKSPFSNTKTFAGPANTHEERQQWRGGQGERGSWIQRCRQAKAGLDQLDYYAVRLRSQIWWQLGWWWWEWIWCWCWCSPRRYILKIHFFIEFDLKMIQFKIQFKTKSKIFIQKNIHSIESRIFNRIIHS